MNPPEEQPISPEQPEQPAPKPKTVSERKLKTRLLWLMLGVKLVVVIFLLTLWESGGFTTDQFTGTLGLLIPVFTTYTGVMINEVLQQSKAAQDSEKSEPVRSTSFQWMAFGIIGAYGIALLFIIGMRPQGSISYAQMNTFLTLLEAGFGIYVGKIVFSLFKKE